MTELSPVQLHPLFLPENEDEQPVYGVAKLTIRRLAPSPATGGRLYDAWSEIRNPEDIARLWGGGVYEVSARDEQGMLLKGGRRKLTLDGMPRPMHLDQQYEQQGAYGPPPARAAVPPAAAPHAPEVNPELAELRGKVSNLHSTIDRLTALLEGRQQDSSTVQLMQAMMQEQSKTFTALIERLSSTASPAAPTNSHEVFVEGMNVAMSLVQPMIEKQEAALTAAMEGGMGGDDMAGLASTVREFVRGMELFKKDGAKTE